MESYKDLGSKYLHTNKKRSIITMIGCFIVSAVLFMFLNSMVCWVEKCRIEAREDDDWEILVLTDDKDTIEKIVNEDFVKSAYLPLCNIKRRTLKKSAKYYTLYCQHKQALIP